ncbi:MAG: beta-N-acetylhexosaminidase, partial [Candidatus Competibacterales bacterium]|nr:beta-N-acetylhexosaminidase [Candidatus Competibacterales bacterium]
SLGPVMLGLNGPALSAEERELLNHPRCGGVILFDRNYAGPRALAALTTAIHALRQDSPLLIAVDHEGGRVQRFQEGFTELPAMRRLGELHDLEPGAARLRARDCGWLLAAELRARGVDFSFTPVLDLDYGASAVIGDRAFHRDPEVVVVLAGALLEGLAAAGMAGVGKHFPGHGAVTADSHHELPRDPRSCDELAAADMLPYARLCPRDLAGVMPAHVIYPAIDPRPAGFSPVWLQHSLRQELGFKGAIVSDDLDMAGAAWAGGALERGEAALAAGCDLLLACNDRAAAVALLDGLGPDSDPLSQIRRERLRRSDPAPDPAGLMAGNDWHGCRERLAAAGLLQG